MIEFISQPWPWWVGGIMISIVMLLMLLAGRRFGASSPLETMCNIAGAGKVTPFFRKDWRPDSWKIVFVIGAVLGGAISHFFLQSPDPIQISESTSTFLAANGIQNDTFSLAPVEIFNWGSLASLKGWIFMVLGGFLIGFGTRYAGGCTSGHSISGLSELQLPSLIATIGFFVGGLIVTHFFLPYLLTL
ncbi:YeeE/YedE family protein [bacterium]|nr:YeeE/YedE family protein [bacterium]